MIKLARLRVQTDIINWWLVCKLIVDVAALRAKCLCGWRHAMASMIITLFVVVFMANSVLARTEADIAKQTIEGVLSDWRYQREFPAKADAESSRRSSGSSEHSGESRGTGSEARQPDTSQSNGGENGHGQLPNRTWSFSETFGIDALRAFLVMAAIITVGWMVWRSRKRHKRKSVPNQPASPQVRSTPPETAAAKAPPVANTQARDTASEAIHIAEAGQMAEAIELLLTSAIDGLRRSGHRIQQAATSREIVRNLPKGSALASSLATLVIAEERIVFRCEPLSLRHVKECADAYRTLEDGLGSAKP